MQNIPLRRSDGHCTVKERFFQSFDNVFDAALQRFGIPFFRLRDRLGLLKHTLRITEKVNIVV